MMTKWVTTKVLAVAIVIALSITGQAARPVVRITKSTQTQTIGA